MKGRFARVALAAAFLMLAVRPAGAGQVSPPSPLEVPPQKSAYFNNPLTSGGTTGGPSVITEKLAGLIASADAGARVRIAVYFINNETDDDADAIDETDRIVAAVKVAETAGARVQVVVEKNPHSDSASWRAQRDRAIASLVDAGAEVVECVDGCFSSGIMHNKFVLVDNTRWRTSTPERVVAQTSANWSNKQLRDYYWNNLLLVWDDPAIYSLYESFWNGMWQCATSGCPSSRTLNATGATNMSAHVFPRSSTDDIALAQIKAISCPATLPQLPKPTISVAMGSWSDATRAKDILDELKSRAVNCRVRIIVAKNEDIVQTLTSSAYSSIESRCTERSEAGEVPPQGPVIHSKIVIANATYNSVPSTHMVLTGSHNFTGSALTSNDEAWMRVHSSSGGDPINETVFAQYTENFETMWAATDSCASQSLMT